MYDYFIQEKENTKVNERFLYSYINTKVNGGFLYSYIKYLSNPRVKDISSTT